MTTIDTKPELTTLTDNDLFLSWDAETNTTRKVKASAVKSYTAPLAVQTQGILAKCSAYWELNESIGIRLDRIAKSHLRQQGAVVNDDIGILKNAASFTGANYLNCLNSPTIQVGNFDWSFFGWSSLYNKSAVRCIFSKDNTTLRDYNFAYIQSSDRLSFLLNTSVGIKELVASNFGSPAINNFLFFCIDYDQASNTLGIQINNGTKNILVLGGAITNPTTQEFRIGALGGANIYHQGSICHLGYAKNYKLSITERAYIYNNGNGRLAGELV